MAIHRVQVRWTGFPGAPGYSSFYFRPFTGGGDVDLARDRVADFFREFRQHLPNGVEITVEPTVEVVDEVTGILEGYEDGGDGITMGSAGTDANYAGPSGAVINWNTNTVRSGRRVRGRTFIVPLASSAYDTDGTLTSSALSDLRSGANLLMQSEFEQELVVWSRPRNGADGVAATVTGARVPDLSAVLRSRRD